MAMEELCLRLESHLRTSPLFELDLTTAKSSCPVKETVKVRMTDRLADAICSASELRVLNLRGVQSIRREHLERILEHCDRLEEVDCDEEPQQDSDWHEALDELKSAAAARRDKSREASVADETSAGKYTACMLMLKEDAELHWRLVRSAGFETSNHELRLAGPVWMARVSPMATQLLRVTLPKDVEDALS